MLSNQFERALFSYNQVNIHAKKEIFNDSVPGIHFNV